MVKPPHPLTDKMCEEIGFTCRWSGDIGDTVFSHSDMRAVADWQLEQVIDWIEKKRGGTIHLHNSEINNLIIDLKAAMRPQEDQ